MKPYRYNYVSRSKLSEHMLDRSRRSPAMRVSSNVISRDLSKERKFCITGTSTISRSVTGHHIHWPAATLKILQVSRGRLHR